MVSRIGRINKFFRESPEIVRKIRTLGLKERPPDITFGGHFVLKYGGEGGIRTLDTFDSIPVFESDAPHAN